MPQIEGSLFTLSSRGVTATRERFHLAPSCRVSEQIPLRMVQESPESAAEKGHSLSPRTPSPSKAGTPRNPEQAALLDKEAGQRGAGNTGQDTLKSATAPSTVSATQAGSYATTKSVGQIALGTALITQVGWAAHAGRPLKA